MKVKQNRKAFTLIEMLVAISVGSSIMLTAVALLHKSFVLQSQTQERIQRTRQLDRFLEQFRSDVAASVSGEMTATEELVLKMNAAEQIVYRSSENVVAREAQGARGIHLESVKLPRTGKAILGIEANSRIATLAIQEEPNRQVTKLTRRVHVAIGRLPAQQTVAEVTSIEEPL